MKFLASDALGRIYIEALTAVSQGLSEVKIFKRSIRTDLNWIQIGEVDTKYFLPIFCYLNTSYFWLPVTINYVTPIINNSIILMISFTTSALRTLILVSPGVSYTCTQTLRIRANFRR